MGEGGCPSRVRGLSEEASAFAECLLTVRDYRRCPSKSQENTLTNCIIILLFLVITY